MKKDNMKKNVGVMIFICLISIIALIIVLCTYYFSDNVSKVRYLNSDKYKYDENLNQPINMYLITTKYKGEIKDEIIYKYVYNFANSLLPEYANLNTEDLNDYYNKNSKYIQIYTGINNFTDFSNLVKTLKSINSSNSNLEFEKYLIDIDSIDTEETYSTADFYIKYKNCDCLVFEFEITNYANNPCEFTLNRVDEEKYEAIVPEEVEQTTGPGRVI